MTQGQRFFLLLVWTGILGYVIVHITDKYCGRKK